MVSSPTLTAPASITSRKPVGGFMSGWIKLHRKFKDWEWKDKPEMVALYIHILLNVNYEQKVWRGITVRRGQFITSLSKLSENTGLSVRQVRTCLKRLESTNEVTSKSTNKYHLISVANYESYQDSDKQGDKRTTNERQTNDKQTTTTKERKNKKKEKKEVYTPEFEKFWDMYGKVGNKEKAFLKYQPVTKDIGHEEILRHHDRYADYCRATSWYSKLHATSWLGGRYKDEWGVDTKPDRKFDNNPKSARQQFLERQGLA